MDEKRSHKRRKKAEKENAKEVSTSSFVCPRPTDSGRFDVFLSFRGLDTRKGFTDHLYHGLVNAGTVPICVFRDENSVPIGEDFSSHILDAITRSNISIPIISENYASSKWCLCELIHMMHCKERTSNVVLPIFYKVDPSDVRNLQGNFGNAFQSHKKHLDEEVIREGQRALREVSYLRGWESEKIANGHEGELVKEVTKTVLSKLRNDFQRDVTKYLVGIDDHVKKTVNWVDKPTSHARMIGIYGKGRIGETTFAKFTDSPMAIGETFLQVLFEKLASLGLSYVQREGAAPFSGISIGPLNKWKKMLVTINAVLDDAEDKQLSGKGPVKLWLDDVRDLAYDMEDLLDDFGIETAQAKSEAESSTSGDLEKWKFPFVSQHKSSISDPNPRLLVFETAVQNINDRLEEMVSRKAQLSLTENAVNRSANTNKRLPSSSLPEPRFFGREKEETEILELLTGEAKNTDPALSIVPIVGMGGIGKTALAQRLYNDVRVSSCFERRAWVCVSDVFNVIDITKTILRSITGSSNKGEDLNGLQVKLKDSLSGKKFLVVLDDVWNENYGEWTALLKPFEAGAKGSKIIVTTRNHTVVSITGASPYPLKELSLDNCTSLLAFHALKETNFVRHPDLETIGKKIAKKCKGSPLASKISGGLLRDKGNPNQWEAILNNKMWDLPTRENDEVLRVLKLSYVHLPSYLKRCFAYCAIFPKDYEIERDELVLLWIVEGFLDGQRAKGDILKLGRTHFDELVSRSFLQQSSVNKSKFSMHDLLNDLAKSIAGETCFTSGESQLTSNEDDASLEKARHASFISSWYVTSHCLRAYHGMKVLRSLIMVRVGSSGGSFSISNKVLYDLLTKLKYLRVFSLCHCDIHYKKKGF